MSKKIRKVFVMLSLLLGVSLYITSFAQQSIVAFNTDSVYIEPAKIEVTTNNTNPMNVNMLKQNIVDATNVTYGHSDEKLQSVDYIVIHSTGNANTSARQHVNYLNTNHKAFSAHWYVDKGECINTVDEDTVAFHSGSMRMNRCSISIEICEYTNTEDQWKSLQNTKEVVQRLLELHPNAKVITHHDVSGKPCPSIVYEDRMMTERELIDFLISE